MDFTSILNSVKKTFDIHKTIDFNEANLHIEMEPLTSSEELKVIEGCFELSGVRYVEALKRYTLAYAIRKINGNAVTEEIDYTDDSGKPAKASKFVFLTNLVDRLPAPMKDLLFNAYANMQQELEAKITSSAKFERFDVEAYQEAQKSTFKPVEVPEEDMTETEKMSKKAQEEVDNENLKMAISNSNASAKAMSR